MGLLGAFHIQMGTENLQEENIAPMGTAQTLPTVRVRSCIDFIKLRNKVTNPWLKTTEMCSVTVLGAS